MTDDVLINEQVFVCRFRRMARAKHIKLSIYYDGSIIVTYPPGVSQAAARQFLHDRRSWLVKHLAPKIRTQDSNLTTSDRSHFLTHKDSARQLVMDKLAYWNQFYDFSYHRVSIRRVRTRWGSCSGRNNLNFNYKLLWLAEPLQDYIIVHELCHLKIKDHSPRFWALVSRTIPDYRTRRANLKW